MTSKWQSGSVTLQTLFVKNHEKYIRRVRPDMAAVLSAWTNSRSINVNDELR